MQGRLRAGGASRERPVEAGRYLQESRKGLLRMVQIISELLEFSRSTYSAVEEADINKVLEGIPDPVGTFYRYGLAKSLLRRKVSLPAT